VVSVTNPVGITHAVEVQAESLFEAAALALAALKKEGWTDPIGPATRLEVEVRPPAVRHTLSVIQLQRWLATAARSPHERVMKERLKALLK
jgi:hypothetical protein